MKFVDQNVKLLMVYDLLRLVKTNLSLGHSISQKKIYPQFKRLYPDFQEVDNKKKFSKLIWSYAVNNNYIKFTKIDKKNPKGERYSFQRVDYITEDMSIFNKILTFSKVREIRKDGKVRNKEKLKEYKNIIYKYCLKYPKACNEKMMCKMLNITRSTWYDIKKGFGLPSLKKDVNKTEIKSVQVTNNKELLEKMSQLQEQLRQKDTDLMYAKLKVEVLKEEIKQNNEEWRQKIKLGYYQ